MYAVIADLRARVEEFREQGAPPRTCSSPEFLGKPLPVQLAEVGQPGDGRGSVFGVGRGRRGAGGQDRVLVLQSSPGSFDQVAPGVDSGEFGRLDFRS